MRGPEDGDRTGLEFSLPEKPLGVGPGLAGDPLSGLMQQGVIVSSCRTQRRKQRKNQPAFCGSLPSFLHVLRALRADAGFLVSFSRDSACQALFQSSTFQKLLLPANPPTALIRNRP